MPRLRVPWVSLFGLLGVVSLCLAFQDSSRQWPIVVWGLLAFATSFGVVITVCSYAGTTAPDASFHLADAGYGAVLALCLWIIPYAAGLGTISYSDRLDALPAEQANAAVLWCQVRRLGHDYDERVQSCVSSLIEPAYRNFKRYPAIVADPRARGELYRQVEAYLAMPAVSEKDAIIKTEVRRKLEDFRHDEAEARGQRELVASLPPALYRDQNGCVRSLETADRSGPCVRLPAERDKGGDR